ncbi:hypothetical protein Q9233_014534 [Columba guinea]|nr:hypothetical protein Q9233_014534 [Columba guinea]
MTLHTSSLEKLLEDQAKDLLALLHQHGPSTEGIFLVTASERATQELREALDSGAEVHLESQPLHLLAVILQDFLRKIPSQLLQAELYQEWMSAVLKTSRQERMAGLKDGLPQHLCLAPEDKRLLLIRISKLTSGVAKQDLQDSADTLSLMEPPEGVEGAHVTQLPSFNVLMKELRGRNAAMTLHSRSLEQLLEDQAKVRITQGAILAILGFHSRHMVLIEHPFCCRTVWRVQCVSCRLVQSSGHHPASPPAAQVELATRLDLLALLHQHGPSTEGIFLVTASERATQELREALDSGAEVHLESQPLHLLAVILQDFLRKIPSQLLQAELYQEWMSAVLKTSRQERMAGLKELVQSSGHHPASPPAAQVELATRLDLLALLHQHGPSTEGIFLVTASERATQELREALDSGTEVHLESQPLHLLAVILQDFLRKIPSQLLQAELYQEWMSAVLKTSRQERMAGLKEPPEGVEGAHVTQLPSFNVLMKVLRGRNAAMTLHSRSLEQLLEDQAKVRITQGAILAILRFHSRHMVLIEHPFCCRTVWRVQCVSCRLVQSSGHHPASPPAAQVELATRLDLLALLHQHGPSTEGIFLVTASERATQELREALDSGAEVHLESQPLHLLAVILQVKPADLEPGSSQLWRC